MTSAYQCFAILSELRKRSFHLISAGTNSRLSRWSHCYKSCKRIDDWMTWISPGTISWSQGKLTIQSIRSMSMISISCLESWSSIVRFLHISIWLAQDSAPRSSMKWETVWENVDLFLSFTCQEIQVWHKRTLSTYLLALDVVRTRISSVLQDYNSLSRISSRMPVSPTTS